MTRLERAERHNERWVDEISDALPFEIESVDSDNMEENESTITFKNYLSRNDGSLVYVPLVADMSDTVIQLEYACVSYGDRDEIEIEAINMSDLKMKLNNL